MPQARIVVESSTNAALEISTKPAQLQMQSVADTKAVKANIRQVAAQMHIERQMARVCPAEVASPTPQQGQTLPKIPAQSTSPSLLQAEQGFFSGTMEGVQTIGQMTHDVLRFLSEPATPVRPSQNGGTAKSVTSSVGLSTTESTQRQTEPQLTNLEKIQREMRYVPGEVQIRMARYPEIKFSVDPGTPFDFVGVDAAGGTLNEAT